MASKRLILAACSPRVASAYDALMATTGGMAEARNLLRWALDCRPAHAPEAADAIARQADDLVGAAREYAAALRAGKEIRRG